MKYLFLYYFSGLMIGAGITYCYSDKSPPKSQSHTSLDQGILFESLIDGGLPDEIWLPDWFLEQMK